MIKDENLFLEEWVIVDFLSKVKDYFKNSKYIELLISLSLIKFCEKQWGEKCWVGLEIQDKYKRDIPKKGLVSHKVLDNIITNKVEEDTDVDIVVAKMPKSENSVSLGMNFQLKRFGKNKYKQNTESLINFLNNDCRLYSKTQTILVILIETPEEINLKLLQQSINTDNYPFEKIILVGISENNYINYYGIWPESGWSRYNFQTLQFDF